MRRSERMLRRSALIVCAAMAVSLSVPFVHAEEKETLKVGYVGFNNFMIPDKDGKMYGYGVEYLEMIGRVAGYDFEYIPCSWAASLEMLLDKEIDLVCTANYSDERAEIYDYSDDFFAHMQGVLYTKSDNNDIYYEDFEAFDGCKIGFIRSAANIELFADYAEGNDFSYTEMTYENEDELHNALETGEVDAIATENSTTKENLKLVGIYDTGEYYLMSYKNNTFMDNIDRAMAEIFSSDNNIKEKLYDKYFTGHSKTLSLTRKEAEYISSSGIITIGMPYSHHPLSEYDEETGKISGITVDIFNRISEISGLNFHYSAAASDDSPVDDIINGKYDIAVGIGNTDTYLDDSRISVSEPYMLSNAAAVGRIGDDITEEKNIIVACRSDAVEYGDIAHEMFGDCEIRFYDTDIKCFDAVRDGAVDYYVHNIYAITYLLQSPVYKSLEMLPYNFVEEYHTAAVRADEESCLLSIINKSIKCISDEDMEEIIFSHTVAVPYKATLGDVVHEYSDLIIAVAVAIVLILGVVAVIGAVNARKYIEANEINIKLREEMARIRQNDDEKKKLLFEISRDIRSPLNTINGITTAAMKHKNDPEKMETYLDKIKTASGLIQETADAITAVCGKRYDDFNEKFLMLDILKEISNAYTYDLERKDIEFSVNSEIICPKLCGNVNLFRRFLGAVLDNLSGCIGRGGCISFSVADTVEKDDNIFIKFIVECDRPQIAEPDFTLAKKMAEDINGALGYELTSTKIIVTCEVPFEKTDDSEDDSYAAGNINAYVIDSDTNSAAYIIMTLEKAGVCAEEIKDESYIKSEFSKDKSNVFFVGDKDGSDNICRIASEIRDVVKGDVTIVAVTDAASDVPAGCDYAAEKSRLQPQIFRIMLELTEIAKERKAPENAAEEFDFKGRHILIADDSEISAGITAEILRMVGAECEVVTNGKSAVKMYEMFPAGSFDAIILALNMPGADGLEACSAIRHSSHSDGKTVPVFALSASGLKSDVSAALAAGMNGHFTKPVDNRLLYKTLENTFKIREKA